jgi:hypothetical protein
MFRVTPAGVRATLCQIPAGPAWDRAMLAFVETDGTLYGITEEGARNGTVFAVTQQPGKFYVSLFQKRNSFFFCYKLSAR